MRESVFSMAWKRKDHHGDSGWLVNDYDLDQ